LLSEVIRNMIEHQPDMIVVGEVIDPLQLLLTFRQSPVDVVIITPLKANGVPKICQLLLVEYPLLKIVTQLVEGENIYLYQSSTPKLRIDGPSAESILMAIRKTLLPTNN
jgi:DNA-binding NarL/FixJ family response regulator